MLQSCPNRGVQLVTGVQGSTFGSVLLNGSSAAAQGSGATFSIDLADVPAGLGAIPGSGNTVRFQVMYEDIGDGVSCGPVANHYSNAVDVTF